MEREKGRLRKEIWTAAMLWIAAGIAFLLVLRGVEMSDGDDTYFYYYARSMGFFEYLSWRYQTWVGRMAGEALVYLVFRSNIWLWRILNACMMVLLPAGVLRLGCKAAGYRDYRALLAEKDGGRSLLSGIRYPLFLLTGYLLMNVMTVGYAAIWMNGSIFYTWTFTAGIWAMMPLADAVFGTGGFFAWQLLYALPCSVVAAMSIEQMGAVLLAFEVLSFVVLVLSGRAGTEKKAAACILVQFAVTAVCFALLFHAPGNAVRVETEIATWMPGYREMTFGEHLFLAAQWLLSSFAKENRLLFAGIWAAGIILLGNKEELPVHNLLREKNSGMAHQTEGRWNRYWNRIWQFTAGIFAVVALLPYVGIYAFEEMGNGTIIAEECLLQIPVWQDMTVQNRLAFFWWIAAVIFTVAFLWKVTGHSLFLLFVYAGGIASEAIMFFSPTIYASGARVFYLTDWMFLFLILWMVMRFDSRKRQNLFIAAAAVAGVCNFLSQYSAMPLHL